MLQAPHPVDQTLTNTYWYDSFPEFFQSIRFCYKKKNDTTYLVEKLT